MLWLPKLCMSSTRRSLLIQPPLPLNHKPAKTKKLIYMEFSTTDNKRMTCYNLIGHFCAPFFTTQQGCVTVGNYLQRVKSHDIVSSYGIIQWTFQMWNSALSYQRVSSGTLQLRGRRGILRIAPTVRAVGQCLHCQEGKTQKSERQKSGTKLCSCSHASS